jgi:hypothetical protein
VERQNKNKSAGAVLLMMCQSSIEVLDYVDWLASIRACTVVGILEIWDSIPFMCGGGVLRAFDAK